MTTPIHLSSLSLPKLESQQAVTLEILARLWLPQEAYAYAERYQHPMRKLSYYASRLLLRIAFANHYQCPPQAPRFNRLANGAMDQTNLRLENDSKQKLLFSVTHTIDSVFLVTASSGNIKKIGLDAETIKRQFHADRLVNRYFSREVQSWFAGLTTAEEKHHQFLSLWTQAEAFFKATQTGLKAGIEKLDFTLTGTTASLNTKQAKLGFNAKTLVWRISTPEIADYKLAIAIYGKENSSAPLVTHRAVTLNQLQNYSTH